MKATSSVPHLKPRTAFHATALTPATAPTIRRLADLSIETLALMHAPAYRGEPTRALNDLAVSIRGENVEPRLAFAALSAFPAGSDEAPTSIASCGWGTMHP